MAATPFLKASGAAYDGVPRNFGLPVPSRERESQRTGDSPAPPAPLAAVASVN